MIPGSVKHLYFQSSGDELVRAQDLSSAAFCMHQLHCCSVGELEDPPESLVLGPKTLETVLAIRPLFNIPLSPAQAPQL